MPVYKFRSQEINKNVKSNRIGNYNLGELNKHGEFVPRFTGRSDTDLKEELIAKLATHPHHEYFRFWYKSNVKDAYEHECEKYNRYKKQLENKAPPEAPIE
ncbi:MAG: hypothetical protein HRU09_16670 [Oligoflexales bacterium]|nr:hypothetical protein [Oligoflexales bacterium]